jgi:predicted transcriptional regulator|tara:strand:- start:774 stop:902 length:129 start_codon:yes stop_codon:yes gene_type:complete
MTSLVIRIDEDLKDKLQQLADNDDRSLSNYIRLVLKKSIEEK